MKLPATFTHHKEWSIVGPMGPRLPGPLGVHPTMAIDGGARHTDRIDLWIGDGDSHPEKVSSPHLFYFDQDKDASDLAMGLSFFEASLPYRLHLWGFLGGRRDHELFNLGEAFHFLEKRPGSEVLFYTSLGEVMYRLLGKGEWSFTHHGLFSLGTFKPTKVILTGECRYQINKKAELDAVSSFGLSNEAMGLVRVKAFGTIFLCFPESP